jgi:hypothetical protein
MTSKNLYHRRLVAESGAKACWICYRPSSTVLITPEQDDWFHVCPGHLKDRKFAIPKDEEDLAEKKRQEELDKEIEAVKAEFAAKMKAKLDRRRLKEYEKEGKTDDKTKESKEDESEEKEKEEKLKALEKKKEPAKAAIEGPRIFELHKNFYQMRIQKRRDAEQAKRNRDRLRNPASFPSVPSGSI